MSEHHPCLSYSKAIPNEKLPQFGAKGGKDYKQEIENSNSSISPKVLEIKLIAHMNILWGLWPTKPSWQQTLAHDQVCGPEFNKCREVHTCLDVTKTGRLERQNTRPAHSCAFLLNMVTGLWSSHISEWSCGTQTRRPYPIRTSAVPMCKQHNKGRRRSTKADS